MTDTATTQGTVEAVLPRALYKVILDEGGTVTASLSGSAKHATVHLLPGDKVSVAVSPYDPTQGRIVQV